MCHPFAIPAPVLGLIITVPSPPTDRKKLARVVAVPVGRRSGSQLAQLFTIPLLFFSPSQPFLIEGELGSKILISEK